jgi:elongation factor 1-beta
LVASCRYTPSQADVTVFKSLADSAFAQYPHALRWYNHIASFTAEQGSLPGSSKSAEELIGSTSAPSAAAASSEKAAPAAAADDDDDVDLFGSDDDEVDEEAEKLKQERLAAYAAKKANKPKTIAKVCSAYLRSIHII